jgi:hypothetical protein
MPESPPGAATPTAVLLNPRARVIGAAAALGCATVVVADPALPLPDEVPGEPVRASWLDGPGEITALLRRTRFPGPVSCFGFDEAGSLTAASVNDRMGWPGNPPAALRAFQDRALLRSVVGDRAGVPVAHEVCPTRDRVPEAAARIGYPCVVKPVDGARSAGGRYLAGPADAEEFAAARSPLRTPHLVEEFLAGRAYSVEAVSSPRGHRVLAVTEKSTTGAPHFVETGHILPVDLAPETEREITGLVTGVLDAAGLRYGPSHTELVLTTEGARLVEAHALPGGDHITDLLALALGEDVFAQAIAGPLGLVAPAPRTGPRVAGVRYVTFRGAVPAHDVRTELVTSLPGVAEVRIDVPPGEAPTPVRAPVRAPGGGHAFVLATGRDRDELERNLDRATRTLTAGTDPAA